jgi:hypothetical protein
MKFKEAQLKDSSTPSAHCHKVLQFQAEQQTEQPAKCMPAVQQ